MKNSFVKIDVLNEMLACAAEGLAAPKPVQYGYDAHNRPMVAFLATDKGSGLPLRDRNGNIKFNWRPSRSQS